MTMSVSVSAVDIAFSMLFNLLLANRAILLCFFFFLAVTDQIL